MTYVVKSASSGKAFGNYKTVKEAVDVAVAANDLNKDGADDWAPEEAEKGWFSSDTDQQKLTKFRRQLYDVWHTNYEFSDPKAKAMYEKAKDALLLIISKLPQ